MRSPVAGGRSVAQPCAECAVRPFAICAALEPAEMQQLEQLGHHVHFRPGQAVFAQDAAAGFCYILLEGVVRLYKLLPDGRRQIVGFALAGDFIGVAAGERHGFSADAVGPVVVCRFARDLFTRFAALKPNLLRRINEFEAGELNRARDQMVLLGRRSAEEKVAVFLVCWRDRLARLGQAAAAVPLPMGRLDIADYLGLTVETVSRTFTKLERDGVIEILPGRVRLLDAVRVEAIAAA